MMLTKPEMQRVYCLKHVQYCCETTAAVVLVRDELDVPRVRAIQEGGWESPSEQPLPLYMKADVANMFTGRSTQTPNVTIQK